MRPARITAFLLWVTVVCSACAGASPTKSRHADDLSPAVLYPMRENAVWSYTVDTGDGLDTLAISRVIAARQGVYEISSGGAPIRYQVTSRGIRRSGEPGWLLKAPIQPGATWASAVGTAKVISVNAVAKTPLRTFQGCVHVREQNDDGSRQVDTFYCPKVGPVMIDSRMNLKMAKRQTRVIARLLGYSLQPD